MYISFNVLLRGAKLSAVFQLQPRSMFKCTHECLYENVPRSNRFRILYIYSLNLFRAKPPSCLHRFRSERISGEVGGK